MPSQHSILPPSIRPSKRESEDRLGEHRVPLGAFADLIRTSHVFVRRKERKHDGVNGMSNSYDIIDCFGIRMYGAMERTPQDLQMRSGQRVFQIDVLDARGDIVFKFGGIIGESCETMQGGRVWGGIHSRIYHEQREIFPVDMLVPTVAEPKSPEPPRVGVEVEPSPDGGNPAKKVPTFGEITIKDSPKYKVTFKFRNKKAEETVQAKKSEPAVNEKWEELLFIVGTKFDLDVGCCGCGMTLPEARFRRVFDDIESTIYLTDRATSIGRISRAWDSTDGVKCDPRELHHVTGVRFPASMDFQVKAVLLGAVFMMDPLLFGAGPSK